jgi:hypothetical protein
MIKSKFWTLGFWLMAILTIFFLFLLVSAISQYYFDKTLFKISMTTAREAHVQMTLFVLAFLLFGSVFVYGANAIYIDTLNKSIKFKNIITRKTRIYSFANLDGYVDTIQKDGRMNSYKVSYLVKNKKFVAKISTFFCSNYDELINGLKGLTYLGFQDFGINDNFKVLFGKEVLDESLRPTEHLQKQG